MLTNDFNDLMVDKIAATKFLATTTINDEYFSQGMDKEDYNNAVFRNILPDVSYKTSVLKNIAKFTGKHLCQSLFFNKLQVWGLHPYRRR